MQSSRQKKKSSQQKKRYHDRVKAKEGSTGPSPPASKGKKEGSGKERSVGAQNTDPPPRPLPANKDAVNKSAKTKDSRIGSNWDRYEEPIEAVSDPVSIREDEEHLKQRLVQLLNLPIHHTTTPDDHSHAHLTSKTQPSDSGSLQEEEEETDTSFLSLDCAALAESLSGLPMHRKLNLDLEFMELCEADREADRDAESGSGKSEIMIANTLNSIVDLSTCARKKDYTFEFKVDKSKSLPGKDATRSVFERTARTQESVPARTTLNMKQDISEEVQQISPEKRSTVSSAATISKRDTSTDDHEDEELDRLLANTDSSFQQRTVGEGSNKSPSSASINVGQGSACLTSSAGEKGVGTVATASNVELDDMLDELLS